jgi:K+-sensing histidine kinase KdpD
MAHGRYEPSDFESAPETVRKNVTAMTTAASGSDRTIIEQSTHDVWLLRAVSSKTTVHGVIAINIGHGSRQLLDSKTRRVEAILEGVSLTLKRLDIGKAMQHLQAQLLRDAFHGTLSHELCSPLAAIQGSTSVLASMDIVRGNAQAGSLVEAISEEVAELDGYIQNLLNATRVTAGGISPRLEWADPRDIVNAAVKRRTRRLAAHNVTSEFAEELPLIHVDSGLIEDSCGQVLENAAKYSPAGSTIAIKVWAEKELVILSVSDQGIGIAPDDQQQLGRKSFRSQRHQGTIPGSGLGFWIASTFVRANGGTIDISSQGQGQGTTVSICLPYFQSTTPELTELANE